MKCLQLHSKKNAGQFFTKFRAYPWWCDLKYKLHGLHEVHFRGALGLISDLWSRDPSETGDISTANEFHVIQRDRPYSEIKSDYRRETQCFLMVEADCQLSSSHMGSFVAPAQS